MSERKYYRTVVGGCVAVLAACALAQSPSGTTNAAPATTNPAPNAASTASSSVAAATQAEQPAQSGPAAKKHHAHKQHKSTHTMRGTGSNANGDNSEYRTALRHCVEGQAAQRDQCLNDAISRYGRS